MDFFNFWYTHPLVGVDVPFGFFEIWSILSLIGRPSAIINFDMPDIWQTVPDSSTITIKQNVRFQVGMCSENVQLEQIQNGRLSAIINFNMPDIW